MYVEAGGQTAATLETGLKIRDPAGVDVGDILRIDTPHRRLSRRGINGRREIKRAAVANKPVAELVRVQR